MGGTIDPNRRHLAGAGTGDFLILSEDLLLAWGQGSGVQPTMTGKPEVGRKESRSLYRGDSHEEEVLLVPESVLGQRAAASSQELSGGQSGTGSRWRPWEQQC